MTDEKPRFTPDPPPQNPTVEEALRWAMEQLQRVRDFWPDIPLDRLEALEKLFLIGAMELIPKGTMSAKIRFE